MVGTDPNHRIFRTKERQAALQRIELLAEHEDNLTASRIADEQRRADPMWRNAREHAEVSLRLTATNPDASEEEIASARDRLAMLESGWSYQQYWDVIRATETPPEPEEHERQRQADAEQLASELRERKGNTNE